MSDSLSWEAHPLRGEKPLKSALLVGLIAGSAAVAVIGFGHWYYGAISLVVLAASLSRYFFPTRYALDGEGVESKHLGYSQRRSWDEFRRADYDGNGVFLSPFPKPVRLDAFRGLFLRFHQNGEEVVYFVRRHVQGR